MVRTSVMAPAIAAPRRWPDSPDGCAPWSLPADEMRFDVETGAGRADGLSVGRKHIEQPARDFEAGLGEQLVQSFGDRFALDCVPSPHDPGPHTRSYFRPRATSAAARRSLDGYWCMSREDPIDRRAGDRRPRFNPI